MYLLLKDTIKIVTSYILKLLENYVTDYKLQVTNVTRLRNFDTCN
jgi:hypothetical protein